MYIYKYIYIYNKYTLYIHTYACVEYILHQQIRNPLKAIIISYMYGMSLYMFMHTILLEFFAIFSVLHICMLFVQTTLTTIGKKFGKILHSYRIHIRYKYINICMYISRLIPIKYACKYIKTFGNIHKNKLNTIQYFLSYVSFKLLFHLSTDFRFTFRDLIHC